MGVRTNDADVLIAGGGVAGSALAILLGRQGLRVELYERASFPREKPCGEGLMPAGVAVLERLGLAEAVGGVPFHGIRYHFGRRNLTGPFPRADGLPITGCAQRRKHLDQVLFQAAARTPGVQAWTGRMVNGPVRENGRVAGLRVDGEERRGELVVAADGAHSRIRKELELDIAVRRKRLGARAHFRVPEGREQPPWVDVFVQRGYELYVASLPGREVLVAGLAEAEVARGSIERAFHSWWRGVPELAARLDGAEQVSEILCASPLAGRARAGVAPGVVLLGDAAGFSDPITGGGMTQALLTSELLAKHVAQGFAGGNGWAAMFERERRALLADYKRLTEALLWLAQHPRLADPIVAAIGAAPGVLSHLIGVAGGQRQLWGLIGNGCGRLTDDFGARRGPAAR